MHKVKMFKDHSEDKIQEELEPCDTLMLLLLVIEQKKMFMLFIGFLLLFHLFVFVPTFDSHENDKETNANISTTQVLGFYI